MLRAKDESISRKLTWMNMFVSGTALLMACVAFIAYDTVTFRAEAVRNLSTQSQIIGSNVLSALLFNDAAAAQTTLSALKAAPNILSAAVYSQDGKPFASYSRDSKTSIPAVALPTGLTETHWISQGQIVLMRSIISEGKPAGTVYICSDVRELNQRQERYAGIAAIVLLACLLTALLISAVFRKAVAEPIVRLAEIARIVSNDKTYSVRAAPSQDAGEVSVLVGAFNEMLEQIQQRDADLRKAHSELEQRVEDRTAELAAANRELEAFSYSVSHDLRAPLRSIDGFSLALLEDYGDKLDANGQDCLRRVRSATQRMGILIDDLLNLSRVTRAEMHKEPVDLSGIARSAAADIMKANGHRDVELVIEDGLEAFGDSRLLRIVLDNLLGNAWKYTSKHEQARIEFGKEHSNGSSVYFVKDDGAGFDPAYSERLFGAFQRLHGMTEFPGTGVGLATVCRIVQRHGGRVWAEGAVEKGATFRFTL
jgi:signal transduction histidine kinase